MKLVRESVLVTAVLLLMAASFTGTALADWTATLVWTKEIGECGKLSYCDSGITSCTYEGDDLRTIEFFDWNGDPTGVPLNFTGHALFSSYMDEGPALGTKSYDDSLRITRFATYDRSGTMLFEITDQDSLRSIVGFMVSGSGRFHEWKHMGYLQEQFKIFGPDGTLLCTVSCDSVHGVSLSQDGQRLYVEGGDRGRIPGAGPADFYLKVYSVAGCSLMYTLPENDRHIRARDADVVAQWVDSTMTIFSGGVETGTLGRVVGYSLGPAGEYMIGQDWLVDETAAYDLGTMTKMWTIAEADDNGEQIPVAFIADNGVALYPRRLTGDGIGITVVVPDGDVLHEEDFVEQGASCYLDGDGEFFIVKDCATDFVSYYAITE